MKYRKWALAAPLLLALASCAVGVNFTKPSDDQLVVGVSKQADVVAALGKPKDIRQLVQGRCDNV